MRSRIGLLFAMILPLTILAACGGDDDTGDASGGTGASGGGSGTVNGCAAADYVAATEIAFTFTQFTPPCVKTTKGGSVTWKGAFASHNLQGGTDENNMGVADSSSPIGLTTSGMEKSITFPSAGTFPFYCVQHQGVGMRGAILVE